MSSDLETYEKNLMTSITSYLEDHGYLPRIRAELKVNALRVAQELAKTGEITENDQIRPKEFKDDDEMLSMCRQLFEFCGLNETLHMLDLEANGGKKKIESDVPQILQLVEKL